MIGLNFVAGLVAIGGAIFAAVHLRREFNVGHSWVYWKIFGRQCHSRADDPDLFWLGTFANWFWVVVLFAFGVFLTVIR